MSATEQISAVPLASLPRAPSILSQVWPFLALLALALALPLTGNDYWALIATRAAIYWVLVSGLNLVVGYAGQLAIGYVALLAIGAYTTSVLAAGNVLPPVPAFLALGASGVVGAVFGVVVGLPALRLRTFYFAMTTLGFATIVTQIALAWQDVTGGGIGISGPQFPEPLNTPWGFYYFCLAVAAVCAPGSPATSPAAGSAERWSRCGMPRWRRNRAASPSRGCWSPCSSWPAPCRRSPAGCSPRCSPTSRRMPSPSTSRCCSSSRC